MAATSGNLRPVVFEFLRDHVSSLMLQETERMSVTCSSMLWRENRIFFRHAKPGSEEECTASGTGWFRLKYLYSYWMDCDGVWSWDFKDFSLHATMRSIVVLSWQPFNGLSWHTFMIPSGAFLGTSLKFLSSALIILSICSYPSMSKSFFVHIFHIILYIFKLLNQQN